jgi:phage gpG-like protein
MAEPALEITGLKEVQSLYKKLPESIFEDTKAVFTEAVQETARKVDAKFMDGTLNVRTGEMRRSFKQQVTGSTLDKLRASVFSGAVKGSILAYVPIHEFGGTVKAQHAYSGLPGGPYLNIPLKANLTKDAGVMRKTAREVFSEGGFIFGSLSKGFYVAAKSGVPMFVLKQQVEIPARLGMHKAAEEETTKVISKLNQLLPKSWRKL